MLNKIKRDEQKLLSFMSVLGDRRRGKLTKCFLHCKLTHEKSGEEVRRRKIILEKISVLLAFVPFASKTLIVSKMIFLHHTILPDFS